MRGAGFGFGGGPGFWFGMNPGQGHRGRQWRGQRGNWFESGDMKYVILKLLRDKPMHGYEVMKALEEETNGCYKPSPGTVYPTLQWLEDEGLVRAKDVDGKKVYEITASGQAFLEENKGTVDDIFERVTDTIEQFVGGPMPEVNKAVGRIVANAYRAAWKHGADNDRRKKIAEVLKRAADELEALVS